MPSAVAPTNGLGNERLSNPAVTSNTRVTPSSFNVASQCASAEIDTRGSATFVCGPVLFFEPESLICGAADSASSEFGALGSSLGLAAVSTGSGSSCTGVDRPQPEDALSQIPQTTTIVLIGI